MMIDALLTFLMGVLGLIVGFFTLWFASWLITFASLQAKKTFKKLERDDENGKSQTP